MINEILATASLAVLVVGSPILFTCLLIRAIREPAE